MLDQDVQQRLLAVPNSRPALWMLSSFFAGPPGEQKANPVPSCAYRLAKMPNVLSNLF
jgi:hypothetical protein